MNIVILSPEAIFPCNSGGRVVVYNRIVQLLKENTVYIFSIVDSEEEMIIQNRFFSELGVFCRSYVRQKMNSHIIECLWKPLAVVSRISQRMQNDINQVLDENKIDILFVEFPQMMDNIKKIKQNRPSVKCILSHHNIEFMSLRNIGIAQKNVLKKNVYLEEAFKMKLYEKKLAKANWIDGDVFVSNSDLEYFNTFLNKNKKSFLSPIGAKDNGTTNIHYSHTGINIIIVGKMSYAPNADGVLWFVNNIWSIVKKEISQCKLFVVGKDPTESIKAISSKDIIVTGSVDSLEPYYHNADLAIIPILSGGGVKTKLIEAASFGLPIVCTSHGNTGTVFENKKDLFVCDDPVDFAETIVRVLNSNSLRRELSNNVYNKFKKYYIWDNIGKSLQKYLYSLCNEEI